ncbi:MAG: hypothetical protein H7315_14485 [Herminiimonas sp.]|nr:hypothetical protein [Herminiimonas sp.]
MELPSPAWVAMALLLVLLAPIMFGKIIDDDASGRAGKTDDELVFGVLTLLQPAVLLSV